MILGNARLLTCPFCGEKKEVISLLSGNTFGADNWSDGFVDAPMCPEPSQIQKCPHCEKYFLLCEQEFVEGKGESYDKGEMSFAETKEAYGQLVDTALGKNIPIVLQSVIFAYNNEFGRRGVIPTASDRQFFIFCLQSAVLYHKDALDPILVAEYMREMGKFTECIVELSKITPQTPYQEFYISQVRKRAEDKNARVFVIPDFQEEIHRRRKSVELEPVADLAEYVVDEEYFSIGKLVSFAEKSLDEISAIKLEEARSLVEYVVDFIHSDQWNSDTLSPKQAYNITAFDAIKGDAIRIDTLYRKAFSHIDSKVWDTDGVSVVYYGEFVGLGVLSLYAFMQENDIPIDKLKEVKILSMGYHMHARCGCFYDYTKELMEKLFPKASVIVRTARGGSDVYAYAETTSAFTIHLMDETYLGHGPESLPGYDTDMLVKDLEKRSCSLFDIIISISNDSFNRWDKRWWFGNTQKLAYDRCTIEGISNEWFWVVSANYSIPEAQITESDNRKVLMLLGVDDRMSGNTAHESFYNTCYDLCESNPTVGTFVQCQKWIEEYQRHVTNHLNGKPIPFLSNLYHVLFISVKYKAGIMGEQVMDGTAYTEDWSEQSPLYMLNKAVCLKNGLGVKRDVRKAIELLNRIINEHKVWIELNPEVYRHLALCLGASLQIEESREMFERYLAHNNCKCRCSAQMMIAKYYKTKGDNTAWLEYLEQYTKVGTGCESCHSVLNYDLEKKICPKAQLASAFAYEDGGVVPQDDRMAYIYYLQAALQGEGAAEYMVGSYLNSGRGCTQNKTEAKKWLALAANKSYRNAQGLLSVIYREEGNLPKALYWLKIMCTPNDYETQFEIARILLVNNLPGAKEWLETSAKGDYADAQYLMAVLSDNENGKLFWLKKAARQGHNKAQTELNNLLGEVYTFNNKDDDEFRDDIPF